MRVRKCHIDAPERNFGHSFRTDCAILFSTEKGRLPMPTAGFIVGKEHLTIFKMLDATEEAVTRIEWRQAVAPEALEGLLEFFRLSADRWHHGKEEGPLFPQLESRDLPWTRAARPLCAGPFPFWAGQRTSLG